MKGITLADGAGLPPHPLPFVASKLLQPAPDKPMVNCPLLCPDGELCEFM